MTTRLTVQPEFRAKSNKAERSGDIRRKAWLAVFAMSALFWVVVGMMIWRFWS
ncbi:MULTISPECIES: YmiA family putative membrane protein [Pantoea]|uniref:YmiA family putative membrane protein n=1 Tax=Candidatus Pantoea multigeneris TaxID=2608357 RepID=A0ABX0R9A1_9GAMM|nr:MULTISPECIES: YmiA family putative membrane protein [Pantoea]NIF21945.1 YmiA family putative membrane protein [Pantoea multigeneris]